MFISRIRRQFFAFGGYAAVGELDVEKSVGELVSDLPDEFDVLTSLLRNQAQRVAQLLACPKFAEPLARLKQALGGFSFDEVLLQQRCQAMVDVSRPDEGAGQIIAAVEDFAQR